MFSRQRRIAGTTRNQTHYQQLETRQLLAPIVVPMDPTGQGRESWESNISGTWLDYTAEAFRDQFGNVYFEAKSPGAKHVTFNEAGAQVQILYAGQSLVAQVTPNSRISFDGGSGNDTFINNTSLDGHAYGGNGRDTLIGGSGVDYLHGGGYRVQSLSGDFDNFVPDDKAGDILRGNNGDDHLIGSQGADLLEGGPGNDMLAGFDGGDQLLGGANDDRYWFSELPGNYVLGSDTIDDEEGDDHLDFTYFDHGVTVDLAQPGGGIVIHGGAINVLNAGLIYKVSGTPFADTLRGNDFDNHLWGMEGSDILEGRGGHDLLWGDSGDDSYDFRGPYLGTDTLRDWQSSWSATPVNRLDFSGFGKPVRVDLGKAGSQLVAEGSLTLIQESSALIANVIGSGFDDLLYGNWLDNRIEGRAGKDRIEGRAGDDRMIGGANDDRYVFQDDDLGDDVVEELSTSTGVDMLDYRLRGTAIKVELNKLSVQNINRDGEGGSTLQLTSSSAVENLVGTEESDILRGNSLDNFIAGRGGDDTISGYAGDDWLYGMDGTDWLYGGYDQDYLSGGKHNDYLAGYHGNDSYLLDGSGREDILDESGVDTLDFRDSTRAIRVNLAFNQWQFVHDTLEIRFSPAAIENVFGSSGDDTLRGNDLANRLSGQQGNDLIYGRGGNDLIYGGLGNDGIYGGAGADTIYAGSNADRLLVMSGDVVKDPAAEDAKLTFVNGNRVWTESEIEKIDAGLFALHYQTGNTRLLKRHNGAPITFVRHTASSETPEAAADNTNDGRINVYNLTFGLTNTWVAKVVVHEIAHNWDNEVYVAPADAQLNNRFVSLSGWTSQPGPNKVAGAPGWYYTQGTEFARDYGKNDVYEDIATSFETYFFGTAADQSRIEAKLSAIDRFMAALAG